MNMWSALIETLKELIKGIPTWAKIVLTFAIAVVILAVAVLNYKLVLVYEIHIDERKPGAESVGYTIEHHRSTLLRRTDERRRFDVYLEAGIADSQLNEIIIRRAAVETAAATKPLPEVRYQFVSRAWTSGVYRFDIRCDFAKEACEKLSTQNHKSIDQVTSRQIGPPALAMGPGLAEAAADSPAGIVVPTLATLRRVAT